MLNLIKKYKPFSYIALFAVFLEILEYIVDFVWGDCDGAVKTFGINHCISIIQLFAVVGLLVWIIIKHEKTLAIFVSISIFSVFSLLFAEIYYGFIVSQEDRFPTPELLGRKSLEYSPALFARNVFKTKEKQADGIDGNVYFINNLGYRGTNFSIEKPKGSTRIMIYGGSFVFNAEADIGKDWPHMIEDRLRKDRIDRVEVINAGIPGHASFDSLGRFYSEGHNFSPDYVVLCHGWNDLKLFADDRFLLRLVGPSGKNDDPRINYRGSVDRFLCEHTQFYLRCRGSYIERFIGEEGKIPKKKTKRIEPISPIALRQFELTITSFVDIVRNAGGIPILMNQPRLVQIDNSKEDIKRIKFRYVKFDHETLCEAFLKIDQILEKVAREKNVILIDSSSQMTGHGNYFKDHVHLTEEGSDALVEIVSNRLKEIINP